VTYVANRQTNKQTNSGQNKTFLSEVIGSYVSNVIGPTQNLS